MGQQESRFLTDKAIRNCSATKLIAGFEETPITIAGNKEVERMDWELHEFKETFEFFGQVIEQIVVDMLLVTEVSQRGMFAVYLQSIAHVPCNAILDQDVGLAMIVIDLHKMLTINFHVAFDTTCERSRVCVLHRKKNWFYVSLY